jgi:hypothetical protein
MTEIRSFFRSAAIIASASGLLLVVESAPLRGQAVPVKVIDGAHMCRTCSLHIEKAVRLTDPSSGISGSGGNLTVIDRDSKGRYWIADYASRTNVVVFGADGSLIKKIGREGSGPGEFRNLVAVTVGPGDTVFALDPANRRVTTISPTTLSVVREQPMPGYFYNAVLFPGGRFVASAEVQSTGYLFQEFDRKGQVTRAFGARPIVGKRNAFASLWLNRRIIPDEKGGFYAYPRQNYFIEHWDLNGLLIGRLDRNAPWFPHSEPSGWVGAEKGFPPEFFGAWVSDGLLFTLMHVRQDNWRKAVEPVTSEGQKLFGVTDNHEYWDSIIEVIDPVTGQLLAATRHPMFFWGVAGKGELLVKGDDPDDYFDIYRVTFVRR